jgi:hypothetical protein
MHAPDCFYIYGYCNALYQGPKENLGTIPTNALHATEVRQFDITIYNEAAIRNAKVVDKFDEETIKRDYPQAHKVPVKTSTGIYFQEPVFENVAFVRDAITEAYFIKPILNGVTKKEDHTYGKISGWGYFKIGKELPPIVETPIIKTDNEITPKKEYILKPPSNPIQTEIPTPILSYKSIFPGCLWPLLLAFIFGLFLFQMCTNLTNIKNNTNLKDKNLLKDSLTNRNKLVEGDQIIINPDDNKIGADSIKINGKRIPVPVNNKYQLLVYDFDKEDGDQISLSYNGQQVLDHSIVNFVTKIITINKWRKGDNYLHIISTSDGTQGICTPRVTLIKNGNILYNKTVGCKVGIVKRLTLKFN